MRSPTNKSQKQRITASTVKLSNGQVVNVYTVSSGSANVCRVFVQDPDDDKKQYKLPINTVRHPNCVAIIENVLYYAKRQPAKYIVNDDPFSEL